MRTDAEELVDYVFATKRKAWHRYSLKYWWWHVQEIANFIINRPLCFFGKHRVYDGIFHTEVLSCGEESGFKCYHCRFCDKPSDEEWCRRKVEGNDGMDKH